MVVNFSLVGQPGVQLYDLMSKHCSFCIDSENDCFLPDVSIAHQHLRKINASICLLISNPNSLLLTQIRSTDCVKTWLCLTENLEKPVITEPLLSRNIWICSHEGLFHYSSWGPQCPSFLLSTWIVSLKHVFLITPWALYINGLHVALAIIRHRIPQAVMLLFLAINSF